MAKFNFGDIVSVSGYYPRVFRIDGYREEKHHFPGEIWSETVYELIDAHCYEWIEADSEDLTLVATADNADEYLANNPPPMIGIDFASGPDMTIDWTKIAKEALSMAKPERKPTARELSAKEAEERKAARKQKAEEIDNLLDRRNWYAEQFAKNGNVEDNERVLAIDQALKEKAVKE